MKKFINTMNILNEEDEKYSNGKGNLSVSWIEYPSYYLSTSPQGSEQWLKERIGRITMSNISNCSYRASYKQPSEDIVNGICGIKKMEAPQNTIYMDHGIKMEPIIRNWYSEEIIKKPIKEVGLAVWKKDNRFGGSLDGEIDSEEGIEIKAPRKMYFKLVEYIESKKKGYKFYNTNHDHIFNSHYDQMTGNGVITNKKYMHYVVVCTDTQNAFIQRFSVDYDLWDNVLYPRAVKFYEEYVKPKMDELNLTLLNPDMNQVD
jgi:hypothetical protein